MNINVFNIVILVGVVQGILFSIFLLASKKFNKNIASRYMAAVVFCFSMTNLQSWFFDAEIIETASYLILFYLPWEMLCPPAFYMFTIYYLNYKEKHKLSRLLYVPSLLYLSVYIYYKIDVLFINPEQDIFALGDKNIFKLEEVIIILLTFLNGYLVYRILKKHNKEIQKSTYKQDSIDIKWFTTVFKMALGLCLFWGLTILFQVITNRPFGLYAYYPVWIGFTFFTYWIGYTGIYKLNIFQEQHRNYLNVEKNLTDAIKINTLSGNTLNQKKRISEDNSYYQKLRSLLENDKIYLDPLLSLEQVADILGISANYLSQLINKITEKHFSDIVGAYRVEEIKRMLDNPEYNNYTVLSIGYEAGFNSKSAIYKTFKKFTSITPSEYRERIARVLVK